MNVVRLLLVALLLALTVSPAAPAAAAVPRSFFGVMGDGPLLDGRADLGRETKLMRASNVGSMRAAFYWRDMQPTEGGPLEFAETDRIVGATARAGLNVLPVLVRAPAWAAGGQQHPGAVPLDPQTYAAFCAEVVRRYGPSGSFWSENPSIPKRPIRQWQIWNEPSLQAFWLDQPFEAKFTELLRAAKVAIEGVDPGAVIVLGGLTNKSWQDLASLYDAGAKEAFDVVALHPFTKSVGNVVKIIKLVRAEMAKHGDASKQVLLTEVSWSSGKGRSTHNYGWELTEKGQGKRVREALSTIAAQRRKLRLLGVYWYTWLSPPLGSAESFNYAGLRRIAKTGKPVSKPSLAAFKATVAKLVR